DLLQLSRVTRAEMQTAPFDFTRLVQAVADRLMEGNPEREVRFTIEAGMAACGDERLLEVALMNLLANSLKFTGTRAQARIEVGRTGQNGDAVFYVRDNGVGFDMTYAAGLL